MKIIIIVALVLTASVCRGQSTQVTWQAQSVKNLQNSAEGNYSCTFRIYSDRFQWAQSRRVDEFTITSTERELPSSGTGSVRYNLVKEGKAGFVTIERLENGTTLLTLDLTGDGTNGLAAKYQFTVTRQ